METINEGTGEVMVPETIQRPGLTEYKESQLTVAEAKAKIEYLQEIKRSILVDGEDYMQVGDAKKPSLIKGGAEKLASFFGYAPRYIAVEEVKDHFRQWSVTINYKKNGKQESFSKKCNGWYECTAKCELVHKASGVFVGDGIGYCCSIERGRESADYNTILKMAQKRAMVAAVLNATYSSSLFTQDVEDFGKSEPRDNTPAEQHEERKPDYTVKDPDAAATEPQVKAILRMVNNPNIAADLKLEVGKHIPLDGNNKPYNWTLTKGRASELIGIFNKAIPHE